MAEFSVHLMDNIVTLYQDLVAKRYCHGSYLAFKINDSKPRDIHKATVRDRLVHHAIYRVLYPYFDRQFIFDSYSCRLGKGTHKALNRFREFARMVSKNHTRTCWVLKCDIRKFFANIHHDMLMDILGRHIPDADILNLLRGVIGSFNAPGKQRVGLPLGNLTSQLLVNIYMNEFDQFAKRVLKEKYYIRYADDFVFMSGDRHHLEFLIPQIRDFLSQRLGLELHPRKLFLKTNQSGVDFLGWIHFPHHRTLRTSTKRRMFKKIEHAPKETTLLSYLGLLTPGNTGKLKRIIQRKLPPTP